MTIPLIRCQIAASAGGGEEGLPIQQYERNKIVRKFHAKARDVYEQYQEGRCYVAERKIQVLVWLI